MNASEYFTVISFGMATVHCLAYVEPRQGLWASFEISCLGSCWHCNTNINCEFCCGVGVLGRREGEREKERAPPLESAPFLLRAEGTTMRVFGKEFFLPRFGIRCACVVQRAARVCACGLSKVTCIAECALQLRTTDTSC